MVKNYRFESYLFARDMVWENLFSFLGSLFPHKYIPDNMVFLTLTKFK